MTSSTATPIATTECGHLEFLRDQGVLRFGFMMNLKTGKSTMAPVLDQFKEGKDGMRRVTRKCSYIVIGNCPICGDRVKFKWVQELVNESLDRGIDNGYIFDSEAVEIADDLIQQVKEFEAFEPDILALYVKTWQEAKDASE